MRYSFPFSAHAVTLASSWTDAEWGGVSATMSQEPPMQRLCRHDDRSGERERRSIR